MTPAHPDNHGKPDREERGLALCDYLWLTRPADIDIAYLKKHFVEQDTDYDVKYKKYSYDAVTIAASRGMTDVLAVLIASKAPLNARDRYGGTALMHAKDAPTMRMLMDAGADVNAVCNKGWTALHHATYAADARSVGLLLENKTLKIDYQDDLGGTALMLSTLSSKYAECLYLLLQHGADYKLKDHEGLTAEKHLAKTLENANQPRSRLREALENLNHKDDTEILTQMQQWLQTITFEALKNEVGKAVLAPYKAIRHQQPLKRRGFKP